MRTAVAVSLIALFSFSILASIATIGKPRKPITPGLAVAVLILDALLIAGVVYLWRTPITETVCWWQS